MTPQIFAAPGQIDIGVHNTISLGGATFNIDTIAASLLAGIIVVGFGLYVRIRATDGVPHRTQLAWEMLVTTTERHVERTVGSTGRKVVPLAISLFAFILIANWLELVPSGSPKSLPPPTGDINLTVALAGLVILMVHGASLRARGLRGYLRHYLRPSPWLLPINFIEEMAKPVTLALRLFGNVFAGAVVAALILDLLPPHLASIPLLFWKLFAMCVAVVQAFLFALLTILYFQTALKPDEEPSSEEGHAAEHAGTDTPVSPASQGSVSIHTSSVPPER